MKNMVYTTFLSLKTFSTVCFRIFKRKHGLNTELSSCAGPTLKSKCGLGQMR